MKNLYQVVKDYIAKPLMGIALIVGINGCGESNNQNYALKKPVPQIRKLNQFSEIRIGKISNFGLTYPDNIPMMLGDMDGDGDLDIVLINREGEILVYENNIPQKRQ